MGDGETRASAWRSRAVDRGKRIVRLPLALIPPHATMVILSGPARGMKWIAGSSVHGCWIGSYERSKQRTMLSALHCSATFYDIGAHAGYHSLAAARQVGAEGRVIAVEPLPANLANLRKHVALNKLQHVEILAAAAGEREGRARFHAAPASQMGRLDDAGELEIDVVSVDALVARGYPPPHVMKIDVEGFELSVLRGARETMQSSGPIIFLATHGAAVHRACLDELASQGYGARSLDERPLEETDELIAVPRATRSPVHPESR